MLAVLFGVGKKRLDFSRVKKILKFFMGFEEPSSTRTTRALGAVVLQILHSQHRVFSFFQTSLTKMINTVVEEKEALLKKHSPLHKEDHKTGFVSI